MIIDFRYSEKDVFEDIYRVKIKVDKVKLYDIYYDKRYEDLVNDYNLCLITKQNSQCDYGIMYINSMNKLVVDLLDNSKENIVLVRKKNLEKFNNIVEKINKDF